MTTLIIAQAAQPLADNPPLVIALVLLAGLAGWVLGELRASIFRQLNTREIHDQAWRRAEGQYRALVADLRARLEGSDGVPPSSSKRPSGGTPGLPS